MARFTAQDIEEAGKGAIAWMAGHPVAANLLMIVCLVGGFFLLTQTTKEVFPSFTLDTISIQMRAPASSPEEVEQTIILAIEEAIRDVDGIGEVISVASEGRARITVEVLDVENMMRVHQDMKTAVDQISTFPAEAEDLTVNINSRRRNVMEIALFGAASEHTLREAAEQLRDRFQAHPDIGPVDVTGLRRMEIHIEISPGMLRRYGLSLPDVAARIRSVAIEQGSGSLKTGSGEILVRLNERRDEAAAFADIPVITLPEGGRVLLGDIAHIREGFEDTNNQVRFNGQPAVLMDVFRIGAQTPLGVSSAVRAEIESARAFLPEGLDVGIVSDNSELFKQRGELMIRNGVIGLVLVVIFLAVFLDMRLAFWVAMGIPISFLGAFLVLPMMDFTVNIITMFAFIIALGIVVDDAIVSGENIYHYRQKGYRPLQAAVKGAQEIAIPITVSVVTNMIAFLPLMFIPGMMGNVFGVIPVVVVAVFLFSLIESLFVLPAHLTFRKAADAAGGRLSGFISAQKRFNAGFESLVTLHYRRFMEHAIAGRYLVLSIFLGGLLILGGYVLSGRLGMQLFPRVDSDYAFASATLQVGAPREALEEVELRLLESARAVIADNGGEDLASGLFSKRDENIVEVRVFLTPPDRRPISTAAFTQIWREKTGDISGVNTLGFQSNRGGPGSGAALTVELSHRDTDTLNQAARELAAELAQFPMTKDIDDGSAQGKRQFELTMTDLGYTLGFTPQDVARQVRGAFFGSEALRQQRGRDDVRVLVRLPEEDRNSEHALQNLMIRSPQGRDVRLGDVVRLTEGRAYVSIQRRDGRRTIQVRADVEPPDQANRIIAALRHQTLPALESRYNGLTWSFEGRQAEIRDSLTSLYWGLLAVMFAMYVLLAILFGSYVQPFMVLIAIPFSAVGAILGHFLMGYSLSVMSVFGMMALAGVVVNGALVLIDFANKKRARGTAMAEALIDASCQRFRPVLLTTLTTFVGLAPMIFETSRQARFLIPMAISLGYGVLFAIFVTLILIPVLYVIIEDVKTTFSRKTS